MTISARTAQDKTLIKKLALAESRGEGVVGMALVINSFDNRQSVVQSGSTAFGRDSSVRGLVFAQNQYAPTRDGSLDGPWNTQELALAEQAYQLASNPAELQRRLEASGVSATNARKLILSTGFDSIGGQGRAGAIRYGGHVFVQPATNYGVTEDTIYARSTQSSASVESSAPVETAKDPATGATTTSDKPIPVPDSELNFDNQFGTLSTEELDTRIEANEKILNKLREKSSDNFTEEESQEWKKVSAEQKALKDARDGNLIQEQADAAGCVARETAKGFTFKILLNVKAF